MVDAGRFFAAIDVFPKEPLEADHPIRQVENAILTHHQAGGLPEGRLSIGEMVVDDLEAILQGFPPQRMQSAAPELIRRY
jgi:phosphoglycerate dehydrogenase-like enzyme